MSTDTAALCPSCAAMNRGVERLVVPLSTLAPAFKRAAMTAAWPAMAATSSGVVRIFLPLISVIAPPSTFAPAFKSFSTVATSPLWAALISGLSSSKRAAATFLQTSLCEAQSSVWHAGEQYFTARQLPQRRNWLPAAGHRPHFWHIFG
eukprot:CAMPEP_0181353854 /NCGR_PEP_ID=MMETSP1106-20121128/3049_1 /TAXON_ID=81844 /ORGANISM="Mantoniella antarctica, Strain SL-175" /LENGTH=148 /DNA_ID=CAMNT_0023466477 /DNA_START=1101 /DNA_END=1547 /DNA_ORIENTATION=+